jgi:hypothetical protein
MDSRSSNVLTEELLASVEQVCRAARACGVAMENLYHGGSGGSAGMERRHFAEEKKWLT